MQKSHVHARDLPFRNRDGFGTVAGSWQSAVAVGHDDTRASEELRRLTAEGNKLEAELGRIRLMNILDVLKLAAMMFGAVVAGLTAANSIGWL